MAVIVPLQRFQPQVSDPVAEVASLSGAEALARALIAGKHVAAHTMLEVLALHNARRGRLSDILLARGLVAEDVLFQMMAGAFGVRAMAADDPLPDPRLIDRMGAVVCLANHLLPCRMVGSGTVIATAHPEDFHLHRPALEALFGPVLMAVAPARRIEAALLEVRGAGLAQIAETRVDAQDSCRSYRADAVRKPVALVLALALLVALLWPRAVLLGLTVLALLAGLAFTGLKVAAWLSSLRPPPRRTPCPADRPPADCVGHGGALPGK